MADGGVKRWPESDPLLQIDTNRYEVEKLRPIPLGSILVSKIPTLEDKTNEETFENHLIQCHCT